MKQRNKNSISIETKISQALHFFDKQTGAVVPSIEHSATYSRDKNYQNIQDYWYRRDGNSTTVLAEEIISELESAKKSILFSSGMSACTAVLEALLPESHVIAPTVMYHGVLQQIKDFEKKKRLRVNYYPAGNLEELKEVVRFGETKLIWVETPNNPNWEVTDIAKVAEIANSAGAMLITDCTATPPPMTRALSLGADISFHSATKYLNGHSDITAGVLSINHNNNLYEKLLEIRKLQGTVLNSNDAWLLIRGMRTLFLRIERSSSNAMQIAKYFKNHRLVEKVIYTGLSDHPGHQISKVQTCGQFGGMISIIVKGNEKTAIDVARYCEIFYPATSLGGVESLIEHRKTVSGENFPVNERLLRLSIGIEEPIDLINDLEQALARAAKV